ncbi:(S)-ureidoglycine aminohydrolase [Photobacterium sanctipauli]|uniref:(S)-ureidoglycine aminohydrolase n=1 Tax=Photobacterium sanctipauli TaxID=1342794 RepID=A0A2T3NU95_9GAMM|nr:(S)-ureidoglycine aminohydrolase [Photobacterium sanctipauli]PSW19832.1 (S)-ureidoglycine aminohydrolase [Photobacterium sanctipauli]
MGYLNQNTGYVNDLLSTRAVIKKDNFAIIPHDGLVNNVIPGFEQCDVTILASPKLGASFVDYLVTLHNGGNNNVGFGGGEIECFMYITKGQVVVEAEGKKHTLTAGGYIYCPSGVTLYFENDNQGNDSQAFLYKRKYQPVAGHQAHVVVNHIDNLEKVHYEGMTDVIVEDLLPKTLGFDMNFHILTFKPGACHGYIETHVQEHGAYVLSGEGVYNFDNNWIPVKKGDYLFMAAYSPQACYAVGRDESFSYIYSKDCNRDVEI